MTATVSVTESQIFKVIGDFLTSILPTGVDIQQGQINRVAQPKGPDYVIMSELNRAIQSINVHSYVDNGPGVQGYRNAAQEMQVSVQCDVYGPNGDVNAQAITTLWRDMYGCEFFRAAAFPGAPMWASEPQKAPLTNAEMQYESRWIVDLVLQCNITVGVPMDFSTSVNVTPINVDVTFPPGA